MSEPNDASTHSAALLEKSADELASTARALPSAAIELNSTSKGLALQDAGKLRESAASLQREALRALLAAMSARAVAERLSVLGQIGGAGGQ
jgi:hypothetical protein